VLPWGPAASPAARVVAPLRLGASSCGFNGEFLRLEHLISLENIMEFGEFLCEFLCLRFFVDFGEFLWDFY